MDRLIERLETDILPHFENGIAQITQEAMEGWIAERAECASALRAYAERERELREALDKHGRHAPLCAAVGGYGYCTCGLEAVLSKHAPK